MSGCDPNRRKALKHLALLGATGLVPAILPIRPAPAASLTAGFVYIGPREDLGWNQSHAVAATALKGVPGIRVVQAGYLPESTDYGSGKDDAETRAYTAAMEGLVADDAVTDLLDLVRRRSVLAGDGEEISRCSVPPGLGARQQPTTRRTSAAKMR